MRNTQYVGIKDKNALTCRVLRDFIWTMLILKRTTRTVEIKFYDVDGTPFTDSIEQPAIDCALSMLAWQLYEKLRFSGEIETEWLGGGMREPQTPDYPNEARRKVIAEPMKKYLPEKFTGRVVWNVNSGELSGKPKLYPR